jgi:hypothetical protein
MTIEVLVLMEDGVEELWFVHIDQGAWYEDNLRALRIVRDKLGQSGLVHVVGMEARACQPEDQY